MQVRILGLLLCKPVHRLIGHYPFTDGEGSKMNRLEKTGIVATAKLLSEFWRNTLRKDFQESNTRNVYFAKLLTSNATHLYFMYFQKEVHAFFFQDT